ncbi:MAG: hypothetical protein KGI67_14905, partial [Pseudomonadota bacterium]|nr:hypothetical protein [Pseudomonadota bacterium]
AAASGLVRRAGHAVPDAQATVAGSVPVSAAPAPAAAAAAVAAPAAAAAAPVAAPAAVPSQQAPASRMDTVIYENTQTAPAEAPKSDCRAMSGDSAECDAFEDADPQLYQRCYQSLSDRINACLTGESIPPLVTH